MPSGPSEGQHVGTEPISESPVRWWPWISAVLVGLIVWSMVPQVLPMGYSIVSNLISAVLGIIVAGLIVGARSVRRWLILVFVIGGLAIGIFALSFIFLAVAGY